MYFMDRALKYGFTPEPYFVAQKRGQRCPPRKGFQDSSNLNF